jgi:subtilisin family serine protease
MKMRRVVLTAATLAAVIFAGVAASTSFSATPAPGTDTGRAIVLVSTPDLPTGGSAVARARWHRLRDRSQAILAEVAQRDDLTVQSTVPEIGMLSVELGPGGLPALRTRLAGDPSVESVHPDLPVQLRVTPNDFAFTHPDPHAPFSDFAQWNLTKEGGPRAWDLSNGTGAEVAMIDSGADGSHPDLARRIVGSGGFGAGSPLVDTVGHGTHAAGLACGDSNNGFGIASMGFKCNLYIAKIAVPGPCSYVAQAITAAANRSSDVISMSIGGCDNSIAGALNYALSRGSVLVAAGDNTPTPNPDNNYPAQWVQPLGTGPQAGFNRGLVVTAARYDGNRPSWAQRDTGVSVAAFGAATDAVTGGQQGILSTFPANQTEFDTGGGLLGGEPPCQCRTSVNGNSNFAYLVGTSMATPQVSGVAALIRAAKPNIGAPRVAELIKKTASNCGTYVNGLGWGLIRADQAVGAALDKDITPPISNVRSAKQVRGRGAVAARGRRFINLRIKRKDIAGQNCAGKQPVSGVKKVIVFASANGGPYHRIAKTKKDKIRFRARPRRFYTFYSVALDKAGNREAAPGLADAKLHVHR